MKDKQKVTYLEPEPEKLSLEVNDLIIADGMHLLVVRSVEEHHHGVPYGYVNLETGQMMAHFSHPSHLINHIKKHHGEFQIVKSHRVGITIS